MRTSIKVTLFTLLFLMIVALILTIVIFISYGEPDDCDIYLSSKFYDTNSNISDIVISLTTMPARLQSSAFQKNISVMLTQSIRPQEIRINIPHVLKKSGKKYEVPEWLEKISVTIVRCEDEGPATKYLPTLRHFAGTKQKVLIYDDDNLMPLTSIKNYQKLMAKYPNSVIGAYGNRLSRHFDADNKLISTSTDPSLEGTTFYGKIFWLIPILTAASRWQQVSVEKEIEKVDIIFGYTGYCLTADMVDVDKLSDFQSMPKEAFFVDDVVLSGHLAARNISRIVAREIEFPRMTYLAALRAFKNTVFPNSTDETLSATVNKDNKNNATMINHFFTAWGESPK